MDEEPPIPGSEEQHASPDRPRQYRRVLALSLCVLIVGGLGLFIATRSFVLAAIARPHIEATIGGDIEIGDIRWISMGRIAISDLVVRAPNWEGASGEVVRIDEASIRLDPNRLASGAFDIAALSVDGMVVRIAESATDPGDFNILALQPGVEGGGDGDPPRRIDIRNLELQMGIDQNGTWRESAAIQLSGDMIAEQGNRKKYVIQFITNQGETEKQSVIKGDFDTESLAFNASIDDLSIDETLLGMMPIELRQIAESMDLSGHVDRIETRWDGGNTLEAAIELGSSVMTVPEFEGQDIWSRLDAGVITSAPPPMIEVNSGRIGLSDDRLTLENFVGRLKGNAQDSDSIPVRLDFQMDLATIFEEQLDWSMGRVIAEEAFQLAPFSLQLLIPDFQINEDSEGVVLPSAAARALSEFGVEEWVLNIEAEFARALPTPGEGDVRTPAEILTSGRVTVNNGTGRYSRFPYPLENVRAYIEFDDVSVQINYLIGNGPNGGSVEVTGIIVDPGPAAEIDVHVTGNNVPADRVFRSALDGWRRRTWDRFFDTHAERQLRDAGLLPGEETVAEARRRRIELLNAISQLGPEETVLREQLRNEAEKLKRVINAGPFVMGGAFEFNLRVTSAAGEESPVHLTGEITIIKGDVILADFPYPIHLYDSTIRLEPEDILLGEGVSFVTPDGGTGIIRGSIHNPDTVDDDSPVMIPEITFAAIDVSITDALLAAIPPGNEDEPIDPGAWPGRWRSEASRAMSGLGLSGLLDVEGSWRGTGEDPDADPILAFSAELSRGSIVPRPELAEFFAQAGIIWPEGFQLDGCSAEIELDPSIVRMTHFEGERKGGVVTANGYISRKSDEEALEVSFRSIQMEEYLLDLVPDEPRSKARELWERFNPRGSFDADLDWKQDAEGRRTRYVRAEPKRVVLEMEGEDVAIRREQGTIIITNDEIKLEDMKLEFSTPELDHGIVSLDGSYGEPAGDTELQLIGDVRNGQFESPVISVMLDLFGAERLHDSWVQMQPSGRFESDFEYRRSPDNRTDYLIDIVASTISATVGEDRLHAVIDEGTVQITPSRVDVEGLVAHLPAPGLLEVNGTVTIGEKIDLMATMSYELEQMPPRTWAYMPEPLTSAFESIDFASEGPVRIHDCDVSGSWAEDAPITEPDVYRFDGEFEFKSAMFTAGTTFSHFDGEADLSLHSIKQPDGWLASDLTGGIGGEAIDVQSRHVTNPSARIQMHGDDVLHILEIQGDVAGGRTFGDVAIDLRERSWEMDLALEGASLQDLSRARDEPQAEGTIGRVLADVRLHGLLDDPRSKRGRGRIIVEEGRMTNSPLTLSIVQLSQFMIPVSDSLDFAEIAFTVDGDRMVFDEFLLRSPTLQFVGTGEMSMNDWELALRLSPRGTIPILSDLIGGVTGTLYAINIGGTLGEPEATVEPLPLLGGRATIKGPASQEE